MLEEYKTDNLELYRMDNMELMAKYPDSHFDLAIVDPPYGIGITNSGRPNLGGDGKSWDSARPAPEYFVELQRVSKNQIVWGGNYFKELWPCKGFIIWDKHQPEKLSFAMVELATCSIDGVAKMFFTKPAGERGFYTVDGKRIHPTQKPIALYKWILENYAKPEYKILDTHLGSGSIAVACHYFGCHLTGCEIDQDYFNDMVKRIKRDTQQVSMF